MDTVADTNAQHVITHDGLHIVSSDAKDYNLLPLFNGDDQQSLQQALKGAITAFNQNYHTLSPLADEIEAISLEIAKTIIISRVSVHVEGDINICYSDGGSLFSSNKIRALAPEPFKEESADGNFYMVCTDFPYLIRECYKDYIREQAQITRALLGYINQSQSLNTSKKLLKIDKSFKNMANMLCEFLSSFRELLSEIKINLEIREKIEQATNCEFVTFYDTKIPRRDHAIDIVFFDVVCSLDNPDVKKFLELVDTFEPSKVLARLDGPKIESLAKETLAKFTDPDRCLTLDDRCFEEKTIELSNPEYQLHFWFVASPIFAEVHYGAVKDIPMDELIHTNLRTELDSSSVSLFDDPSTTSSVTSTSTSTSTSSSSSSPSSTPLRVAPTPIVNDHPQPSEEIDDRNYALQETFDNIQQTSSVVRISTSKPRVIPKTPNTNARRIPYSFRDRSSTKRISTQFSHLIIDKENGGEDFECEYEIEDVLNRRMNPTTNVYEYEVKWKEYDQTTWEPRSNFDFNIDDDFD